MTDGIVRQACGKCGDGPISEVVARIVLRRKNRRGKKKRAGKNDDLKEDSDQEEARVRKLGAWLECGVWSVSLSLFFAQ